MDSNKGLLVPINYNGQWRKGVDECWTYDALFTRYVRVKGTTTYMELIDMICAETKISLEDNIIEVHGWMSDPVKEMSPPFIMLKDIDISTFIELNAKREVVVPLCISTSEKPNVHVVPPREPNVHVNPNPNQQVSNSVNQPEIMVQNVEKNRDVGLEDIKLSNSVDGFVHNGDAHSLKESIQEEAYSNDEFDYDDPFNYDVEDVSSQRCDPFEFGR